MAPAPLPAPTASLPQALRDEPSRLLETRRLQARLPLPVRASPEPPPSAPLARGHSCKAPLSWGTGPRKEA